MKKKPGKKMKKEEIAVKRARKQKFLEKMSEVTKTSNERAKRSARRKKITAKVAATRAEAVDFFLNKPEKAAPTTVIN